MKKIVKLTCLGILILSGVLRSCEEEGIPILTTEAITDIKGTQAKGGGNIIDEGYRSVIERGVCWSTSKKPTIADNKTSDGAGLGNFESYFGPLIEETTYYVRAYATTSVGTWYGNQVTFTTPYCMYCMLVTTDNSNGNVNEGFEIEYCAAELEAIQAIGPKTVGTQTTVYRCREK